MATVSSRIQVDSTAAGKQQDAVAGSDAALASMQMAYECSSEQVKSFGFAYRMMMEMLGALLAFAV